MDGIERRSRGLLRRWACLLGLLLALALPAVSAQDSDADPVADEVVAEALKLAGTIYVRSPGDAWDALEGVRDRARQSADPEHWADWNLLASVVETARGDLDAAMEFADIGYALYEQIGTQEGSAWATLLRGEARSALGRYPQAIEDFEFVLERSVGLEDATDYQAQAWIGLGHAYAVTGDFASSLEALTSAYAIFRSVGDSEGIAVVFGLLGNVYTDIDATEMAIEMYEGATALDRELGDELNVAINLYNTARAYTDLGRTEEARALYDEALELSRRAESLSTEGYIHFGVGRAHAADGDSAAARAAYEKAEGLLSELNDRFQVALIRHQLARLDLDAGDVESAMARAEAAMGTLEAAEDTKHLIEVLDVIAQAQAARGDYAAAFRAENRRATMMEEHASTERARRVAQLRVTMDTDRAEDTAKAMEAEAELKEELLERERFENRLILGSSAVLVAVLLLLAWSFVKQKRLESRLRHLADTDDLTGTLSRRRLFKMGDKEIHRAARYESRLSVLLLDLDYFKTINDRYGHATGDEVLALFARVVQDALRDSDAFGRIGGEEFIAILPETDREQAMEAACRLVKQVANLDLRSCGVDDRLTMSVGVTVFQGAGDTLVNMIKRADAALYEAKNRGRNQARADWALAS